MLRYGYQQGTAGNPRVPDMQGRGRVEARSKRAEMRRMPPRVSDPGRHPRDAGGRGEDRRIGLVKSVLACLPTGSRVVVVRLRSLGDCVLTTPALDILKRCRPDLRIAVVVEDRFHAIFERNPDVETILPPEIGAVRKWRPSLCLNF